VFFVLGAPRSEDDHAALLRDPAVATFLAEAGGRAIAYLRIGPSADDVAMIVRDPGTASITGAFTEPEMRREGVATALLDTALGWARDAGYVRCAVDHESANPEATRFWRGEFEPVAVSYARVLPPSPG
jgi:GNAT superfamily N-acetyltransferase